MPSNYARARALPHAGLLRALAVAGSDPPATGTAHAQESTREPGCGLPAACWCQLWRAAARRRTAQARTSPIESFTFEHRFHMKFSYEIFNGCFTSFFPTTDGDPP